MKKQITIKEIYEFLKKVDGLFPVPLSKKLDLEQFSEKLLKKGTICFLTDEEKIVSFVGGYTENIIENKAYISVVATLEECAGKGYAKKLVKDFIEICKNKKIDAVHLYTATTNISAINMYKKIGFTEWKMEGEPRKDDLHLIYYIGEDN